MPIDIIEMQWECTHCKHPNMGRDKVCGGPTGKCVGGGDGCGKTRSERCREWLPADVSHESAAVITEATAPGLLGRFKSGPDDQCTFCGTSAWKIDGSCFNCGAPKPTTEHVALKVLEIQAHDGGQVVASLGSGALVHDRDDFDGAVRTMLRPVVSRSTVALVMTGVVVIGGLTWAGLRTVKHPATVTDVSWTYTVHVEREQKVPDSGFNVPAGAEDIIDEGQRVHHHDKVIDHYDMERYEETVRDPDACVTVPPTCSDVPKSCRTTPRTCSSNKNGSATCSGGDTVCSGGGQSCSGGGQRCTPRSHLVPMTRQVPVYRDVPVYSERFWWTTRQWVHNRDVVASSHDVVPRPPSPDKVALGDHERVVASLTCTVTFTDDDDHVQHRYVPRGCGSEFQALAVGTRRTIVVNSVGGVEIWTKN